MKTFLLLVAGYIAFNAMALITRPLVYHIVKIDIAEMSE